MSYIAGNSLEDMKKYLALWYVATTVLLAVNALSRRSVIALGLAVGLVALGGYKLKKIQSSQKTLLATVSPSVFS